MKFKKILSLVIATVVITTSSGITTLADTIARDNSEIVRTINNESQRTISFNDDWKFNLGDVAGAKEKDFNDSEWRELTLPHDWSIELDFNKDSPSTHEGGYLDGGTGWYRKSFVLPKEMEGKKISINFNGVYMDSYVYVNGKQIGNHPYGYTPFSFDVTDDVICDGVTENVIAVKVTNQQKSSRWYSGSGIYRDVNLTVTENVHVAEYGTYVTTPDLENEYKKGRAKVNIQTDITNDESIDKEVSVKSVILDAEGNSVAENVTTEVVSAGDTKKFNADVTVENPILWGTENPYLYKLTTTVIIDNQIVDEYKTDFGIRWVKMTTNDGFFLNGEQMKLEGVCMHHDQGSLGAVDNKTSIRRQVKKLKEMGVNSIRVTHNPASQHLIDICNEEGILLIEEAFDTWYGGKKTYDYGRFFEQKSIHGDMTWAEYDLKQMVNRGKNDPSIIMWSLGNEVWETSEAKGVETAKKLVKWTKEVDDTRPTTFGENKFMAYGEGAHENVANVFDVVGFNYGENQYDKFRKKYDNWIICGSETSSATRSRGVYSHPEQKAVADNHVDLQQSSYDNDYVSWGKTAEDAWKIDRDREYILGQYIWTGFDYIGEPTPYYNKFPAKSSYFGAIDTAGFEKDAFYFYQSQWSDEPMVHLLPHWNWEDDNSIKVDGDKILVYAYTNANSVDLYFNEDVTSIDLGQLVESKEYEVTNAGYNGTYKETKDGKLHLEFRVPYKPGKLTAVAKDENGKEVARDVVKTANDAKKVDLSADRQVISADGYDLSFITVDVVDENGTLVPDADNLINFEVKGNGKIVGVDNGNAASVERYKDNKRKAFNGKSLVIVQSTKNAGSFTLTATSQGLASGNITVYTVPEEELGEKKIVGYDVKDVIVPVNGELKLPDKITALYTDGTRSDVDVIWEPVSSESLQTPGMFKVKGTVVDSNIPVTIKVTVKDIIGVLDSRMLIPVGKQAKLPKEVSVVSNDGSIEKYPVTWDRELTAEDVVSAKTVTIEGKVTGVDSLDAKVIVVVSDNFKEVNIALNEGKAYPKAFTSYTQGYDNINNINDGVISKNNSPKNRWTNWGKPGGNYDEYAGIEFDKEYPISKIGISLFSDYGVAIPSEILVEYWDGDNWVGVSNQSNTTGFSVEGTEEITFDEVNTTKVRALLKEDTVANKAVGLTEFFVYSDAIEMKGTALLGDIKIDDVTVEGFNENTNEYRVNLPYASKVPVVTAAAKDNASIFVVPALNADSNATIIVIAEDGITTNNYIINFEEDDPQLASAKIELSKEDIIEDDIVNITVEGILQDNTSIDADQLQVKYNLSSDGTGEAKIEGNKLYAYTEGIVTLNAEVTYRGVTVNTEDIVINIGKNTAEKTIISYEKVNIETDKGVAPLLPEKVKAIFDIGLPREVKVTWDDIKEESYNKYGVFEVEGTVEGQALKAKARVVVKGISALQNISMATNVKVEPKLPQTVKAYYTDGKIVDLPVTWAAYDKSLLNEVGTFDINGTVEGTDRVVIATIRVSNETVQGDNIAGTKTGFDIPMAIASFTNDYIVEPYSKDRIEYVNDGQINNNRWTNWAAKPRSGDWVGVILGSGLSEEEYINNLQINFFEDSGCKIPASFEIQYYVGDEVVVPKKPSHVLMEAENPLNDDNNWVTVSNLVSSPEVTSLTDTNYYTFDMVKTKALRIKMTSQSGKSLGIKEIKAFEERVEQNSDFVVNGIKVNGKDLDGFAADRYNYTMKLKDNEELPEITVDATNNASASVIYTVNNSEKLEVIVKSENGLKEAKYGITLEREAEQGEVDKTALRMAIDYAVDAEANGALEGVVPVVVKEFRAALEHANKVYDNAKATTTEVNEAFTRLVNAIHMLEFKAGDKTELNRQIEIAEALIEDKYTEGTWSNLQKILEEAKKVSEDENALEKEVKEVHDKLVDSISKLEVKPEPANKLNLKNMIEKIEALNKEEYIPSTWATVEEVLAHAKAIYEKEYATKVEVDEAYEALLRAYLELRLKPDKSKLEDLINKVKEMDLSKYTDKTAENLKTALNRANEVLGDEEATKSVVEKAVKDLELAVAGLEEKKDNEENGGNNNNNGNNNNQGNNGNNGNNNSGNNKPNKDRGKGSKLPSTGAVISSSLMLLLGAGSVIAGGVTLKKRKREE